MSFFGHHLTGVADVFLRSPDTYRPLLGFLQQVMLGESELSAVQREIIAAHVSGLNGCEFCVQAHIATLKALGASDNVIVALQQNSTDALGDAAFQNILHFAEKLTLSPDSISQMDIDALHQTGFGEQTIEDAINVIALFNYVNRLVDAFGVQGNPRYFERVGQSLARQGYARLLPDSSLG